MRTRAVQIPVKVARGAITATVQAVPGVTVKVVVVVVVIVIATLQEQAVALATTTAGLK